MKVVKIIKTVMSIRNLKNLKVVSFGLPLALGIWVGKRLTKKSK